MDLKISITQKVLEITNPGYDLQLYQKSLKSWWYNIRKKPSGGLRLTELGHKYLTQAGIKYYKLEFDNPIQMTNQLTIRLDHYIDCPYYITSREVYVYTEKTALQLILFSNNLQKFTTAKARHLERT